MKLMTVKNSSNAAVILPYWKLGFFFTVGTMALLSRTNIRTTIIEGIHQPTIIYAKKEKNIHIYCYALIQAVYRDRHDIACLCAHISMTNSTSGIVVMWYVLEITKSKWIRSRSAVLYCPHSNDNAIHCDTVERPRDNLVQLTISIPMTTSTTFILYNLLIIYIHPGRYYLRIAASTWAQSIDFYTA